MSSFWRKLKGKDSETPRWALNSIREARENGILRLDLSRSPSIHEKYKLSVVPPEIFELPWLRSLELNGNRLTTLPDSIGNLANLRHLDLNSNQLTTLPESISHLVNLQHLNLNGNQFTTIPDSVFRLSSLRILSIANNKMNTVKNEILNLTHLQTLSLVSNELTIFPQEILKLPELEKVYIGFNPIDNPPPEILFLKDRNELFFDQNDIDQETIVISPDEVEALKDLELGRVDLEAVRGYFRQKAEVGEEALYEAKLLIVGEPGAGKTSLALKLMDPDSSLPAKDESTEGIDVHPWEFPISVVNERSSVSNEIVNSQTLTEETSFRVNIWDFGGQEIYHATHQFFLTRRSLYIVVADAREQKTDFFHWLDLIDHLSDRSPVIIFNNAFQNRHWAINEQQLQAHFPETFQKPFAFNLADDEAGLTYLRQKIQEQITQLPHVGDVLPRTWANVRRSLENDARATVSQQEFMKICKDNGFTRKGDALQLSAYLHDLGVILHFQNDPLLKKTVILKPEWGTDAVYRILDNEQVKANMGFFSRTELYDIWHQDTYALLHDELLALMTKFQLCYAIPNQEDHYIAPQLLSEQPPGYKLTAKSVEGVKKSLFLRYKYDAFMPKGLLTRFIVAMHPHIATEGGQQMVWRTGVILEKDGAWAEVVEFYHRREIRIRVTGKNMRDLLTIVSYQLDELHRPFHRLKFDKLIPCNCTICHDVEEPNFYRLDVLKTRLEHGRTVIECDVPPFETVQIRPLLDDFGAAVQPTELPTLLRTLNRDFNDDEFRTLCLELSVNYDNLPGEALEGKQRELLLLLERHGRLPELINLLRQKRPNWNRQKNS